VNINKGDAMKTSSLPSTGFLRLNQIIGDKKQDIPAIIPVGRSTWLQGVSEGIYPAPIRLSARCVAYRVEDIRKLIAELGGK
jgi:prophage regulatory protein